MRETTEVVEVERRVQARPETVFSYLVDPEKFRQWQGIDAELDVRPGGTFRTTVAGRNRVVATQAPRPHLGVGARTRASPRRR